MKYSLLTMICICSLSGCQAMKQSTHNPTQQSIGQKVQQLEQQQLEQQQITFDHSTDTIANNAVSFHDQLKKYHWQLQSAVDSQNIPIKVLINNSDPIVLDFVNDKVAGKQANNGVNNVTFSVGCNSMASTYQLDDQQVSLAPIISTEMYCSDKHLAESKLAQLMAGDSSLLLRNLIANQARLIQEISDGSSLVWYGTLTDEAKYGKGQTLFLEIAPQLEYCSSGINQQCLKVREVYYQEDGTKADTGDWRLMKHPIEGYRHDPKYRKLLRVTQYITDPVDVKGKQLKYILDGEVETEVVE